MFGPCKICKEKDARIYDLKSQLETLRKLVFTPTSASSIPVLSLEADRILSGSDESTSLTKAQIEEMNEIESERSRLLSGTF